MDSTLLSEIGGAVATHLASGRVFPVIDELVKMKSAAVGIGVLDDLDELKKRSRGRISLLGNLNGVEMKNWTEEVVREKVKILKNRGLLRK